MSDRMMATSYRFEQNKGTHVSKRHAQELKISVKDYLKKNYVVYVFTTGRMTLNKSFLYSITSQIFKHA